MARTHLATQEVTAAGLEAVFTTANVDGHSIDGGGDVILEVVNGAGAPITVTVQSAATVDGLDVADQTITVTNGERRHIGRFPPRTYDRPSGAVDAGRVYVDFSSITSITVAALGV